MALVKKGVSSKKLIRLIVIFALVAVVGGVVVMNITGTTTTVNTSTQVKDLPVVKDTGIDLLDDSDFVILKQHGEIPVEKGDTGKPNPFTSFIR